jgi:transposase
VRLATRVKNRIKALARGCGISTHGRYLYRKSTRGKALERIDSPHMRWQMQSLWRLLDSLENEVAGAMKKIGKITAHFAAAENLQTVPGIGPVVCASELGWIAEPERFEDLGAINAYAGLGLGQGVTSWQPVGPARASRRGNRYLKRALFLAANNAVGTSSAIGERYRIRLRQGWERKKALRDVARKILHITMAILTKGVPYDDGKVNGPDLGNQG